MKLFTVSFRIGVSFPPFTPARASPGSGRASRLVRVRLLFGDGSAAEDLGDHSEIPGAGEVAAPDAAELAASHASPYPTSAAWAPAHSSRRRLARATEGDRRVSGATPVEGRTLKTNSEANDRTVRRRSHAWRP